MRSASGAALSVVERSRQRWRPSCSASHARMPSRRYSTLAPTLTTAAHARYGCASPASWPRLALSGGAPDYTAR